MYHLNLTITLTYPRTTLVGLSPPPSLPPPSLLPHFSANPTYRCSNAARVTWPLLTARVVTWRVLTIAARVDVLLMPHAQLLRQPWLPNVNGG